MISWDLSTQAVFNLDLSGSGRFVFFSGNVRLGVSSVKVLVHLDRDLQNRDHVSPTTHLRKHQHKFVSCLSMATVSLEK